MYPRKEEFVVCRDYNEVAQAITDMVTQSVITSYSIHYTKLYEPKDFVYRLDAGTARHVDLEALARLCEALNCELQDILVWETNHDESL